MPYLPEPIQTRLEGALRRAGRGLLTNHLIFHHFSWVYDWMTQNPIWFGNAARLLQTLAPDARGYVLDLGAGPGNSSLAMGQVRPELRFVAFDLAPAMILRAQENRLHAGWPATRLTPMQGNAFALPFADNSVAAVTAHSFLYLLPGIQPALAEVRRVLRPGGVVAFLEPGQGPPNWVWLWRQQNLGLLTSLSLWRVYSWVHRRFACQELGAILAEAGFVSVTTEETLGGFGIFARAKKRG